jgi:hypothetical protein
MYWIRYATSNTSLIADEWDRLLRYVALHDVRNPARYDDNMNRWQREVPDILEDVLNSSVKKLEEAMINETHNFQVLQDSELLPIKVSSGPTSIHDQGFLKAEVTLGRQLWLFSIQHLLTKTYKVLGDHTWSLIEAPEGVHWLTSDYPMVRLNYYHPGSYDFKGGWGNKGSEILFPLSPKLLLYTQIGNKVKLTDLSIEMAERLNECIAQNAYRFVFAEQRINNICAIVPR